MSTLKKILLVDDDEDLREALSEQLVMTEDFDVFEAGNAVEAMEKARAAIYEVGEPNIGLQFDLYHRQIQEGDVSRALGEFGPLARHYQIASPPDRGEPDDGEMNYRFLFQQIDAMGYDGWIGCEYKPRGATLDGLGWAERCGVTLG